MTEYILITPVKNEQETIEKMIISIICQTKKPTLFVIIDGRGTDETPNIVEEYAKRYPGLYWYTNVLFQILVGISISR